MENPNNSESKRHENFQFDIRLDWLELKRGILSANDVRDTIRVATPKTFGGTGEEWSPEHLFLGSVSSCYMTTLLAIADKMKIDVSHFNCHAIGLIEKMEGQLKFTKIDIYPKVYILEEESRDRLSSALEKAQRYCLISKSINCPVIYHIEILIDRHPLHRRTQDIVTR